MSLNPPLRIFHLPIGGRADDACGGANHNFTKSSGCVVDSDGEVIVNTEGGVLLNIGANIDGLDYIDGGYALSRSAHRHIRRLLVCSCTENRYHKCQASRSQRAIWYNLHLGPRTYGEGRLVAR